MIPAHSRRYLIIWYWLMALVIISVAAVSVLPRIYGLMLIFTVAVIKAFLVARNYMHLKNEKALVYAVALVPLAFMLILLLGLFPDFVYHFTKP